MATGNNMIDSMASISTVSTYLVQFDGNGATEGNMSNMVYTCDTQYILPQNTFIKDNYTFLGWNTKADGSGGWVTDQETIENLHYLTNIQYDFDKNGIVNYDDAVYLLQYILMPDLFPIDDPSLADINKDGEVTTDDAVALASNPTITLYAQWKSNGTIHIFDNTNSYNPYQIYIYEDDTNRYQPYTPYIYDGSQWVPYNG